MRRVNSILTIIMFILFTVHMVSGAFILLGIVPGGNEILAVVSFAFALILVIHALIGVKLTIDSLIACKRSGASYFKENRRFWAARISGFAIMLFVFSHMSSLGAKVTDGVPLLERFGVSELVLELLFVLSIAVHVILNVKPQLISLGFKGVKEYAIDILFVLSVLLLFAGAAFVVYYFRWL